MVVEHADEAEARAAYPQYLPMSTTILGLHRVSRSRGPSAAFGAGAARVVAPSDAVRGVLAEFGFGLVLGPRARARLMLRDYTESLSDR